MISPPWHSSSNELAKRGLQDIKLMSKSLTRDQVQSNWKEVVRKIQNHIGFAPTKKLQNKSPAELILKYRLQTFSKSMYQCIIKY